MTTSGPPPLRISLAQLVRETRVDLDITQLELASAAKVSRAHIAAIESGRCDPSFRSVERIAEALGIDLAIVGRRRIVVPDKRQIDLVHARCSGFVDRRLRRAGWEVRREVTIGGERIRGWIDLLAYEPRRRILLVIEIKTSIEDLGAVERQVDWHERESLRAAAIFGWQPRMTISWLLALESDDVDAALVRNRGVIEAAFPDRAATMRGLVVDGDGATARRGLALIDPRDRRRDWLHRSRIDGRRTLAPYRDYAAAAAALG